MLTVDHNSDCIGMCNTSYGVCDW